MQGTRVGFVMEQTLGHVTHYLNLREAAAGRDDVAVTWMPIPFEASGLRSLVPAYGNWSVRASLRARRAVSDGVSKRQFDALFFHTQVTALFSEAVMRRVPTVISLDATPVNFDTVAAAYGHRAAAGSWLDRRRFDLNRSVLHAARALVTWSEWAKGSLVADYGVPADRVRVVAPGAAAAYFRIGESRRDLGSEDRPVRLLFVGGDFARKGGQLMLAAARAARTKKRFEIDIVTRENVPSSPSVRVHRAVAPNSAELLRLFRDADAFVLPTFGDCLAMVLMEASASGLPIITTNVGAMTEAAVPARNAIVVPPGDVARLRNAIETLVDDETMRRALGRAGHDLAVSRFDAGRNASEVLDLVASVADPLMKRSVA